ncbi:GNAT family N-acetyltransferase [Nitratireductor basaltis]|uniref:GCN5-related N-acetyltransferase n=1 Tax=Nitratireductor basaltis TaxID=472175 RepID=A0A084UA36_9HYPH|nr:GNAT family N-acetyltransferase [Nitratireductor basaltis]KFB09822.1 GCN5-related N-acetyltransferase [Nitratireductor basaltis]
MSSTSSTINHPGQVRGLRPSEMSLFRDHLLRLDAESRRDRFNGTASDHFIMRYAERCLQDGTTVVGYVENGRVLGAAELHERPDLTPPTGEIAFSVERELQHRGLGAVLFQRLVAHARALGYTRLRVTTHPQNRAMRSLAAKFHARLTFEEGETVGLIELSQDDGEPDLVPRSIAPLTLLARATEAAA